MNGRVEVVSMLIDRGARIEAENIVSKMTWIVVSKLLYDIGLNCHHRMIVCIILILCHIILTNILYIAFLFLLIIHFFPTILIHHITLFIFIRLFLFLITHMTHFAIRCIIYHMMFLFNCRIHFRINWELCMWLVVKVMSNLFVCFLIEEQR